MSEQSPYAAPVPAAPPVPHYDSPGMTLTELSFAPLPTAEPQPVAMEPPPVAPPWLVQNVLPAGGKSRRLPRSSGRTPLIALVLVLLLAGAGVVYGTGMLKSKDKPARVVPVKTAKTAAKPVPKPAAKPLVGRTITVAKKSNGTFGADYTITAPTGWRVVQPNTRPVPGKTHPDILIVHPSGQALLIQSLPAKGLDNGTLPALVAFVRTGMMGRPGVKPIPGAVSGRVAGVVVGGFDFSVPASGSVEHVRALIFARNGTAYVAQWNARPAQFKKSLATLNQLLATLKFA